MLFIFQILMTAVLRFINPITILVSVCPAVIAGFFVKTKETAMGIAVATGAIEAIATYVLYKDSFQRESAAIAAFIAGFLCNALTIYLVRLFKNRRALQT